MVTTGGPPSELPEPPGAGDHVIGLSRVAASGTDGRAEDFPFDAATELLGLSLRCPASGVCVVTVEGELDMLTAPMLARCLQEQLSSDLSHLVLDLQRVSFLDSKGLNCLVQAQQATQLTGTQLHLAGLITRAVGRPLQVSQLLELFTTYPTAAEALATLLD